MVLKDQPDYKKIYTDILNIKYPHKKEICASIMKKEVLNGIDVINLNKRIFDISKEAEMESQKHRSYREADIIRILRFQKQKKLNNSEVAQFFNLSRNTVTKWKKTFVV